MRRLGILVAISACPGKAPQPAPHNETTYHPTDNDVDAEVTQRSPDEWGVRVTRTQGERTASVTIITTTPPKPGAPAPHAELAAADAWLAIAREAFAAGVHADAITAARAGIKAIGADYRPKLVKDDTAIRLAMADESIQGGDAKEGATSLISVLDQRVHMYFLRYPHALRRQ
ncbi:hypothetical protein BH11MYX3_BH11MYX3_36930 [soil metagenome]